MRIAIALLASVAIAAETVPYQWGSVATSGGGYFVGVEWSPHAPERPWVFSDVAGPWIREPGSDRFDILALNRYEPYPMGHAEGAAFDPQDPLVVYAAFGQNISDRYERGLYRSRDGGSTWTRIFDRWGTAGGEARKTLPGIAVDQRDGRVLYFGTNKEGLWRSLDRGDTWAQVRKPDAGTQPVRALLVDGRTAIDGRSATVWMGWGKWMPDAGEQERVSGLEVSRDGGATFAPVPIPDGAKHIYRITQGRDGIVWVATAKGLLRIDGDAITVRTPAGAANIRGVDIDPGDPLRIVALGDRTADAGGGWGIYRSTDGGANWLPTHWSSLGGGNGLEVGNATGWYRSMNHRVNLAGCSVRFDPSNPKRVWLCDAYMVWTCRDIWANPTVWDAQQRGLDDIVTITLACPPAGNGVSPLISGVSDVRGFLHHDIHEYPRKFIMAPGEWNTYVNGIAWCERKPTTLMVAKYGKAAHILRSVDAGQTWTEVKAPQRTTSHGGAKILLSADDDRRVVYVPANKKTPWYSTDGGESWQASTTPDGSALPPISDHDWAYNFASVAANDLVDGKAFYIYRQEGGKGQFWVSRDGGATFALSPAALPGHNPHDDIAPVVVRPVPGRAGWVWIALAGHGVWRSDDFGATFSRVPGIPGSRPLTIAFGKEKPGLRADQPTLFVHGAEDRDGPITTRMSSDLGATWERIGEHPGLWARLMAADRQTYGRVYLGSIPHASVFYGQVNASAPKLTAPASAAPGSTFQVTLEDAESTPMALRLRVTSGPPATLARTAEDGRIWTVTVPAGATGVLEIDGDDGGLLGTKHVAARIEIR
jgi:xyloglucan-specific exo-beta-1,4-glucanase